MLGVLLLGVFLWISPPSGAISRWSGSTPESRLDRLEGVRGAAEGVRGASEREDCLTRLFRKKTYNCEAALVV